MLKIQLPKFLRKKTPTEKMLKKELKKQPRRIRARLRQRFEEYESGKVLKIYK